MKSLLELLRQVIENQAKDARLTPNSVIASASLQTYVGKQDRDLVVPRYHLTLGNALAKVLGCHSYTSRRPHDLSRGIYAHEIRIAGLMPDATCAGTLWDRCLDVVTENHEATAQALSGLVASYVRELSEEQQQNITAKREASAKHVRG